MPYDKEAVYDEQIFPLMAQIIKICKENDIQMFTTFALTDGTDDPQGPLLCSSATRSGVYNNPDITAISVIMAPPEAEAQASVAHFPSALTGTDPDDFGR